MLHANDAYSPNQIAKLVNQNGVKKASLPLTQMATLAILAGAFIAFGAMFYTVVITESNLGFGPTRLLGGVAFSLGLVLVVIAGAELFTGNNLTVIAWAERKVSTKMLLRHWIIVYLGNLIGSLATAWFVVLSGVLQAEQGSVATTAMEIATNKVSLDSTQMLFRGILCNVLVCLAVWLCVAAHSVSGKILAIVFPITAFVALGFEHSVANMYLIGLGLFYDGSSISIVDLVFNLVPVTIGNIIGGSFFVALVYWVCYLKK